MKSELMRKAVFLISMVFVLTGHAYAGSWEDEFSRICGSTDNAMGMTVAELEERVGGCDKLLEEIQTSSISDKKVYIFRLKKCRSFYDYMAGFKKEKGEGK